MWDLKRGRFKVAAVMEADGTIGPYGKRDASNRWCAISPGLLVRLRPVVMATAPGDLVFTAPGKAHADIAALMGHADERSTKRYIHSGDERFDRAQEALARSRNSQATHDLPGRSEKAGS